MFVMVPLAHNNILPTPRVPVPCVTELCLVWGTGRFSMCSVFFCVQARACLGTKTPYDRCFSDLGRAWTRGGGVSLPSGRWWQPCLGSDDSCVVPFF